MNKLGYRGPRNKKGQFRHYIDLGVETICMECHSRYCTCKRRKSNGDWIQDWEITNWKGGTNIEILDTSLSGRLDRIEKKLEEIERKMVDPINYNYCACDSTVAAICNGRCLRCGKKIL